ncbi:MAG: hypothetical protein AB7I50_11530 [Vicinamibacterales bacterium]
MEPLALFERRLHPEVGGARQNALGEREDALHVEFVQLDSLGRALGGRDFVAHRGLARLPHLQH